MAIIKEKITKGDREFEIAYSDANRYIVYNGDLFERCIAPADSDREYTEGEIIETEEMRNDYLHAYKIMMGVEE